MAYSLEIKYSTTWYDVTSYVTECSPVPIVARNVNYELDARGFDCSISASYNSGSISSNTRLSGATYVRFGSSGTVYFLGKIRKKNKNYQNHTYHYEIVNALIDLDDYYVDEATLDSSIIGEAADGAGTAFAVNAGSDYINVAAGHGYTNPGDDATPIVFTGSGTNDEIDKNTVYYIDVIDANNFKICTDQALASPVDLVDTTTTNMTYHEFNHNFCPYDNEGLPNLTVRHLIESMFAASGLDSLAAAEVSTGSITTEAIADNKCVFQSGESWDPSICTPDFDLSEIRLDKNMLYCINQDYAMNTTKINTNDIDGYDTESKKVTCWELLRHLCSLFYLNVYYSDGYTFVRNTSEGTYSISNATTYSYDVETVPARLQDSRWIIKTCEAGVNSVRLQYNEVTTDVLKDSYKSEGTSENALPWYNHLLFLVEGGWAGAANTDITLTTGQSFATNKYNFFTPEDGETGGKKIGEILSDEATKSYTKKTFVTAATTTFQNVVLNELDPRAQTSTIVEVTW